MIAPRPDAAGSGKPDILADIVGQVLAADATQFEVEYDDGMEEISAMHGSVGIGIASLESSSAEAQELRDQLDATERKREKLIMDPEFEVAAD
jgi:hypothetical protein